MRLTVHRRQPGGSRARRVVALTAVAGAAVVAVTMSGVAFAGWRIAGFTTADAQAANPTLEVHGGAVDGLYPGGTRTAMLDVRNTNDFPVNFDGFAFDHVAVDAAHQPACPPEVVSLAPGSHSGLLLPGEVRHFEVPVQMDAGAPQGCMGATFTITWAAQASVGTI